MSYNLLSGKGISGASYKRSKKGSTPLDVLVGVVMFLAFAITAVFAFKVLSEINTEIQADSDFNNESKASINTVSVQFPTFMDNAFLMMVILFWVFIIVSSFFIDTYPAFFVISFIFLVFVFIVGMYLSNTYEEVVSESGVSTYADSFPKMSWIMEHLLLVLMVIGVSSSLALYANSGGGL